MFVTSLEELDMGIEVKDGVQWMTPPKELPSLAKESASMQIPTERVAAAVKAVYARIDKHRATNAQKEN